MGASQDNPRTGYRRVRTVSVRLSRKLRVVYRVGWRAGVSRLLALLLAPACGTAWALPEGMTVAAGQVNASQPDATSLVLNQVTHKAILDWRSFNIQAGESVRFVQLDASSAVLNRVGSGEASRIFGSLSANGQVFLINPAGVLFAPGAQVNVGSLVASTLSLSNADFLAGRYRFENGGATGEVANHGIIRAQPGGYVLLAGPVVTNGGLIQADGGAIGLAAGSRVTLDTSHAGLVRFSVDGAALGALASNSGTLQAEGGAVVLKARSIGDALATVVNHTGVIRAGTATERNGMVVLSGGESGVVRAAGEISATGTQQGQAGGTVQLFGDKVLVTADARLDASGHSGGGTILVGGDYQGRTADAPNASRTHVAAGAQLAADATVQGDGGKVVVWADGDTRFAGSISARGGVQGGDGGLVEVSGKQQLDFRGRVDVAAPLGTGGKVLLDPQDIVLNATTQPSPPDNANGTPDVAFADPPAAGTYTIQIADVTGFSELFLQATNDITVAAALTMAAGNSIRLEANNNINVNGVVAVSSGGTINLKADADASGTGTLTVASALTSSGGAIALEGASYVQNANVDVAAGSGSITVVADSVAIAANTGNNALGTSGTLTLKPKTGSQAMSLAGSAGFDLSTAELAALATGATGPIVVGDAGSSGSLTIGGAVNLAGKNLTLNAGTISDTGVNTITAATLTLNANGQIGTDSSNGVDVAATTLRVNTTGNNNAFVRSGAITVGTSNLGSGTLDLRATGNVAQSGAITAGTLRVKTVSGGTANITLTNAGNDVASVDLRARNAVDTANAAGAISYTDANAVDIAAVGTTGTASVTAGGALTQSGAIVAGTLAATTANAAGAAITLDNTGNDVANVNLRTVSGTVAAPGTVNSGAAIRYTDTNAVAIGSTFGINGSSTGAAGTVTLLAGGAITHQATTAASSVKASSLDVTTANATGAAITLTNANNDSATVNLQARDGTVAAVGTGNSAAAIAYRDSNAFSIAGIHNGTGAAGSVSLQAAGTVTQTGTVNASSLTATLAGAASSLNLDTQANAIGQLAAVTAPGGIRISNGNNALAITGAQSTTGQAVSIDTGTGTLTLGANVASSNGAVTLAAGAYVQNANVDVAAGSGSISVVADSVSIAANAGNNALGTSGTLTLKPKTGSQAMSLAGSAGFDLSTAELAALATGATGPIVVGDAGSSGSLTIGGAVNLAGKNLTLNAGTISDTGVNTITAATLTLNANGQIGTDSSNGVDVAATTLRVNTTGNNNAFVRSGAITVGSSNLGSGTLDLRSTGNVAQSGAITAGTLRVKTVSAGTASITLANAGNDVASIDLRARNAADTANAAGAISYTDASAVDIAAVGTTGTASVITGGALTQSGAIVAGTLAATTANAAGAAITLDNAGNDVANVNLRTVSGTVTTPGTVNSGADIRYTDTNAVAIGSTFGINATSTGTAGSVTLLAGGNITHQSTAATSAIKASALEVTVAGGGSATLTNTSNDASSLNLQARTGTAAAVGASNSAGAISFTNANAASITSINSGTGAGGAVTLVAGGAVTQAGAIKASTLSVTTANAAGAAITLDNTANAVASVNLQARTGTAAAVGAANANAAISYTDSDALAVTTVNSGTGAGGAVTLLAGGAVTQTGAIKASTLSVTTASATGAAITLTNAGNDSQAVNLQARDGTVAAVGSGRPNVAVAYTDSNAISVGGVTTGTGAGGNVTLIAGGAITQTGVIAGNTLSATTANAAGAAITLDNTANAVASVNLQARTGTAAAVGAANANAAISYTDSDALAVTTVNSGTGAGGAVTLLAGGAVTQTGAIKASTLSVTTASATGAAITLTNAGNDSQAVNLQARGGTVTAPGAGNSGAAIAYRDSNAFSIAGIHNGTGAAGSVSLQAAGTVTQTGTVNASSLTATLAGAASSLNLDTQANAIGQLAAVTASGGIRINNGNNALAITGAQSTTGQAVSIDTGTGTLTLGANVASSNGAVTLAAGAYVQNANVDVAAGSGSISVVADSVSIAANAGNNALGTSGTLTLKPKTGSQAMSLAGSAGFDLSTAELAALATGATGPIVVGDAGSSGSLTIGGAVNLAGKNLTLNAGTISDTGVNTITAATLTLNANGQIGTDSSNGVDVAATTLRVNTTGNNNAFVRSGAITVGTSNLGSGTLDLRATGNVAQSGAITAGTLRVKTVSGGTANITLTNAGNDVASVDLRARNAADTANAAGAISYTDTNGFDVVAVATTGDATLAASGNVTQSGSIVASGLGLTGAAGNYALQNAGNAVSTLAASSGAVTYRQAGTLTVGTVGGTVGVTATSAVAIETTGAASNLVLNNAVASSAIGDAVILKAGSSNPAGVATGGQVLNNMGAAGISATNGRYLVYSGDPSTTTEGVTGYAKRYNTDASYVPGGSASMFLYRIAPTLTITANNKTRVYGDANPAFDGTATGFIDGDTAGSVGVNYSSTAVFNTPVASSPVAITAGATNNENYTLVLNGGQLTITPRALTVTAAGSNKVYDGTTSATVTLGDNRVAGDVLTLSNLTADFDNKNVGTGKTVSVNGINVGGASAGNYTFNTTATTTADITQRALSVNATGQNRVYDGTTGATVTLGDNRVAGDVLSSTYGAASFLDKNVGNGKTVNVNGISITGTDAANYTFNTTAATTADITQRALSVSATGQNRVYDGTTGATVTLGDNRVAGDVLSSTYGAASFLDKNVGTGKTVNVNGINVTGTDAANYTFNTTTATTADITQRALTVSATGQNRVYDGTTGATVTLGDNRVAGDVLSSTYGAASFLDKNVGTGKTVNVNGISVTGTDAANYTFNMTTATTADITQRALTVNATGQNRVYDGTTGATVTLGDNRVAGDVLSSTYGAASFLDKNVGNGKTVNVNGINVTGTDAANYTFNTTAATTADITQRALTVNATGQNRVYDGTTGATVTLGDNRVAGDVLSSTYGAASFLDKNVGNGKTVNVNGISVTGTDAANYTFNTTATTTANISKATISSVSGITAQSRPANGTTGATLDTSASVFNGKVLGDLLSVATATGSFLDALAGVDKPVSITGISLGGVDAGNYNLVDTTASTVATITPAPGSFTPTPPPVVLPAAPRTVTPPTPVALSLPTEPIDGPAVELGGSQPQGPLTLDELREVIRRERAAAPATPACRQDEVSSPDPCE